MPSSIKRIDTTARMSHIVVHRDVAYFAGAIAKNLSGDIHSQVRETLEDIETSLAKIGSDKSRILSAQIWLKDVTRDFSAMNETWEQWIPEGAAPARATGQVEMASPDILVEIIITAAVGEA
jgi:enamine deaminase RidA (YjgF/YER057c/UK114 family)